MSCTPDSMKANLSNFYARQFRKELQISDDNIEQYWIDEQTFFAFINTKSVLTIGFLRSGLVKWKIDYHKSSKRSESGNFWMENDTPWILKAILCTDFLNHRSQEEFDDNQTDHKS